MASANESKWRATSAAVIIVIAGLALWSALSRQTSSAQSRVLQSTGPLVLRGFTDAPAGIAMIAGDPFGGPLLLELRIKEGQKVKRDEVVAVLSNYSKADVGVRNAEANLAKQKLWRESIVSGYRRAEIVMQEGVVRMAVEENALKALEIARSGKLPEMKQLELSISQQALERQQAKLRVMKETLNTDLAVSDAAIKMAIAALDNARIGREQALVRSPVDGVVVHIYSRQGESVGGKGIAKIVDFSQLRILADVDDVHLGRIAAGGKVEVSFIGSKSIYRGKIERVAQMVKRVQDTEVDHGSVATHSLQVEIELDDPSSMPQMLGREAHVTFL